MSGEHLRAIVGRRGYDRRRGTDSDQVDGRGAVRSGSELFLRRVGVRARREKGGDASGNKKKRRRISKAGGPQSGGLEDVRLSRDQRRFS